MQLSIIIPTLEEANSIIDVLTDLQPLRKEGHEVIVVDGGSLDDTVVYSKLLVDKVIVVERSRAKQMNAGARHAGGEVLLFLHADTRLPVNVDKTICEGLTATKRKWGRFDVRFTGRHFVYRIIELSMNWRSRLSSIATGDQAIFVIRSLFNDIGGFPDIPLMEDIALCKKLKSYGNPLNLSSRVITSSRRWERRGVIRTILLMWRLRLAFFLGADPNRLVKIYYPGS